MKKQNHVCKTLLLIVVLLLSVLSVAAADRYSVATGNWNVNATWSATSGGAPGASFPVAGDNAFIEGGFTATITAITNCTNLSVANGSTLSVGGFNITVSGTTSISGTITFTDAAGTKQFTGLTTIAAGGTWNNGSNAPINFRGGVTNNNTFTAGTGIYTFNTNNQSLTGTLSIPNVTVTGITLTNNGTLAIGTALAGNGGLTQDINASLDLGGTSAITTLTASNNGNTVNFSGAVQTVKATAYYNLTISGSGNKTMPGNVSTAGTLTLTAGTFTVGANTLALSNGANLSYGAGSLTGGSTSNLTVGTGTDIALNAIAGGLNNFNTGRNITLGAGLSINGTLTLTAGTFTVGANTLTLTGPTIAGTPNNLLTAATSSLSFGGSSAGVNIPGSVANLNNLTINNANGVTMNSNISLAAGGVLTLTSGLIHAGTYILKINNTNPAAAIVWTPGSFVNVTTGGVERTLLPNLVGTGNNYLFPIGNGGVFKGINLREVNTGATGPVLRASVSPTGALTGDGITMGTVYPRYWSLTNLNSGNFTNAKVELYESGLDLSKTIGMSSAVGGNYSAIGGASNSPSIISPTVLNPGPYFCIGASVSDTYYSYQTGDWNTSSTWTSDPSGTLQHGSTIPGDNDKVIILTDRTVSLSTDIATQTLDITIEAGGFLDQNIYRFTNGIYALRGQGTIKQASVNFPITVINTFVNAGGGTAEYNNSANFTLPAAQTTYNNLTINSSGFIATQLCNITLNGNLYVKSGTFQINNNVSITKLTLTINGNVIVDSGAFITVGNGVTNTAIGGAGGVAPFLTYYLNFHTVIVKGDFTNDGSVKFTNLPYPVFNAFPPIVAGATSGAASVYFQGASDNTINCNGVTNFYNLIVDKGIDQTFKLTINSTNYSNFRLFGANVMATDGAVTNNPNLRKSLWIRNGTLVLKGVLIIPSLSEGTAGTSDYYIPSNGALIVDGVDVVVMSSADDYREINVAYTVAAPNNAAIGVTMGGFSAVDIFGKLQINNGYLSTRESGGLITSNVASGQFIINEGTVDAKQFLSSTGSASYTQTGGLFILRGRFQRTPTAYSTIDDLTDVSVASLNTSRATNSISSGFGSFNLEQPTNIFTMSGGTIRIYDVCGVAAGEQEAFDVKSSGSNINVTGGTLEIVPTAGSVLADPINYSVYATASLNNFIINRTSSTSIVRLNTPLIILNDLSLNSGDLNANNFDISIGHNFIIENGTSYTPGTNTTTLNGAANQTFTINLAAPLSLNKFTIDKPAGVIVDLAGSQNILTVNDNFRLVLGTLNDNGKTINIAKNVYNSGLHRGTGKVVLNGTLAQSIDGNGIFENVELNNTTGVAAPVSLAANMTVNGALTFSQDKLFNIGTYNLQLNSTASIVNAGATRYLQTAGNAGDGGLTKVYTTPAAFLFPVGAPTIIPARPVKYTPATIGFSTAPSAYGSITVVPVGYEDPATTVNGQSLTYFWRVKSSGFSGVAPNSVTHTFVYDQSDVVGTEGNYIPASYDRTTFTWNVGTNANPPINTATNTITDWTTPTNSGDFLDANYTAGDASFGVPQIYYSRQSGLWSTLATWSLTGHTVNNPPAVAPGVNDIVIIGGQDSVYLATNLTVANTGIQSCASLRIEVGSALDIGYNPGCNFAMVVSHASGNGNFRVTTNYNSPSTFIFPSGDYSDFNVNRGTTELYTTNPTAGTEYYMPVGVSSYGNLILSPRGGSNLMFSNNNITIYGNLITRGQNADSWFCPTWGATYPGPVAAVAKTITIKGDMDIQGGALIWYNNGAIAQNFVIEGNVKIAALSSLYVASGATNQSMAIGGSLINNANGLTNGTTTTSQANFTGIPLTFFGSTSATISSTVPGPPGTPRTIFSTATVNKGTSQATTLTCDIGGTLTTPTDNWLILQNGTFRYMRTDPGTDFTISTTTPFTVPETSGLSIDYANANNRNVLIGNAANNNGDLLLSGKLTLIRGNVYVGQIASPANNNDIEYSGSGASAIEIQGGNLVVNGQIRRNTTTTNGILNYSQSGGTVSINGNAASAVYAKLEVLNSGSVFNMSGGTLSIIRGGGTTYGDLYLRPESSSVTGGTIVFTNVIPNALQNYSIDANIPLNNLTITGAAGVGVNANLGLMVSPLELNGTLTLSNTQSIFNSNNINFSLKGNLDNSGTYNYGTNTTTFNGGVQVISGSSVTNFYNLNVSSVNSLTVNNDFSVNQDLFIGSGSLILGNKKVNLFGNLVNNGSYTDDNTSGGVSLSGTALQQITGTGAYGTLEINNNSGAKLNNDINLLNDLVLTQGVLDINQFLLTLSENSLISGAPFGITKMIKSDGVISNLGVRKFFTAAPQSFTFPVGVSGKYTPAIFTISASAIVGYIKVTPVNGNHPTATDPLSVLHYYWQIESSGITSFTANVLLQFMPGDVYGVESDYVAAKQVQPGNFWYKAPYGPATDNVDETNHQIIFNYTASNNLNGDYTAGTDTAIPGEIPTYLSNSDGTWSDETIWTPVGSSPPCEPGGPNGAIVIIDHVVTIDVNRVYSFNTTINNRLRIVRPTFGHSLGVVSGNGTIYLEEGNLPAGNYTSFTNCSGNGTIEYGGIGTYSITIIATLFNSLPNMFLTGTGTRVLPNKDLTICKRLVIDGPVLDNSVNKRKLIILGSMEIYNTGSFVSGSGAAPASTVSFAGTSVQTLGGPSGDFSGSNKFNNLEINNPAGLIIGANGLVEVNNQLLLSNGIISTSSTSRLSLLSTSSESVIPAGGNSTSFVNGPLIKNIIKNGTFLYPVGKGTIKGHKFTLTSSAASTLPWTVEYFTPNPTSTSLTPPLLVSNTKEYWSVSTNTASKAKVKIGWDPMSVLTPLMTENGKADMRVAEYIAGSWNEHESTASGDNNNGEVETKLRIDISTTPKNFTTASVTQTKARASFSSTQPVCGAAGILISFTSFNPISLNYTLAYTINGVPQTTINVTSLPYYLPTPVLGAYRLTGFTHNNGLNTGVVDGTIVNAYAEPTVSNAGSDQSFCGVSGLVLQGNNPAPYPGLWTIVSGTGGTFINSSQYNTVFTGVLSQTYTLRWTISNVSCTSSDDVTISFPVVAAIPSYFISASSQVCGGTGGYVYAVPNVAGNTYAWSYSGTGHTINGTGNSVTIDFSTAASSGTLSVTATNSCGTSPPRTVNITVNTLPVATFSYAGTPYCPNAGNTSPTFSGGGVAGTFSSTTGLVFVSTATGEINIAASIPGSYTVTNTIAAAIGCSEVTATSPIIIISDLVWTGAANTDWNDPGNWTCGFLPNQAINGQIPNVPNKPVLSLGAIGAVNNIVIDIGSSLTISGNAIQISGTITNNGIFTATAGTVELNGTAAQVIGSDVFTGNTINNLTINNTAGITLQGPLNISGIVYVQSGTLASAGHLTLLSTAIQTAFIDGAGAGNVLGDVTMQRYLDSGFGYKYFSSPFVAATVSEFGDDMDLASSFPLLYRYNEDHRGAGWVSYATGTNVLIPMAGYAVNFGDVATPKTVDVTGVVNSGSLSVTLFNHDSTYTKGFNLVGNPYPSAIDWNAAGWTKTNIDNAVYYFRASTTDQYGGTYSSYINGISTDPGVATNIIPSMQGFFVHVTDGSYPVTGTLGLTNSVRINDLSHAFLKSAETSDRILIRASASFTDDPLSADPLVIYFDEDAQPGFEGGLDALKLMNTDMLITNFYSVIPGGKILSVNALPGQSDTALLVPLGLKTYRDGEIRFKIRGVENLPESYKIYFRDAVTGANISMLPERDYKVTLTAGDYNERFFLAFLKSTTGIKDPEASSDFFSAYVSRGQIRATVRSLYGKEGVLTVYDLSGRPLYIKKVYETGYLEFDPGIKQGIYVLDFTTGNYSCAIKLVLGL